MSPLFRRRPEPAAAAPPPKAKALDQVKMKRIEQRLNAILRGLYVDPELLPYPERLLAQRFNMYAQNEEDGLVLALLKEVGIEQRTFVEIGCGENGGNSGFLALELGFAGLMVDGSEQRVTGARRRFNHPRVRIAQEFVTRENVNELVRRHGFAGEVDFLSIDVDGNDAWLLDALEAVSPRVLAIEFNSLFGGDRAVTIPYDPEFVRSRVAPKAEVRSQYYGVSLAGAAAVGRRKGYRLVVVEPRGTNAFLVRDDLAPHIPALDPEEGFRLLNKHHDLVEDDYDIYAVAERHGLELVEVG